MLAADQRVLLHFPYLGLYMSSGYVLSPVLSMQGRKINYHDVFRCGLSIKVYNPAALPKQCFLLQIIFLVERISIGNV